MSLYSTDVERCGIDGERLVETTGDPLVGRAVDRYQILRRLGRGGMGSVYLARHAFFHTEVALKVLFGEFAADRSLASRFRREALAAHNIKHPNVASAIDFGVTPEGLPFLVMEYVPGRPLSAELERAGVLAPPRAAHICAQIAAGLAAAHALGFIHRDLKPANVLVAGEGRSERAKILDFGLVAATEPIDGDLQHVTTSRQVFGTPAYMAPEQVTGAAVCPATDLYALGIILYEMLAGHPPFQGPPGNVYLQQASLKPPPLREADGLDRLAMHLLEKDARDRPGSAHEVIDELEELGFGIDRAELALGVPGAPRDQAAAGPPDARPFAPDVMVSPSNPGPRRGAARTPAPSRPKADMTDPAGSHAIVPAPRPNRRRVLAVAIAVGFGALAALAGHYASSGSQTPVRVVLPPGPSPKALPREAPGPRGVDAEVPEANAGSAHGPDATADLPGLAKPPDSPPVAQPTPSSEANSERPAELAKGREEFVDADARLKRELALRGITFDDLRLMSGARAAAWARWRAPDSRPSEVAAEHRRLLEAMPSGPADRRLLSKKLERVRPSLERAASTMPGERFDPIQDRYIQLKLDLERAKDDRELGRVAKQLADLERDLRVR